jgi:hypothetical protein
MQPRVVVLRLLIACVLVVVALVFVVPGCGGGGAGSAYMLSISHIKMLNDGMITYAGDFDDALPPGSTWMDSIGPYVPDPEAFHSPLVPPGSYGYALNVDVAGHYMSTIASLDTVVSIFDSTDLTRNATQATSTQPNPPRYGISNTIAYLDGHVKDEAGTPPVVQTLYTQSKNRMKKVNIAMFLYSSDYDDYAPLANQWMDELTPYVSANSVFRSPKVEQYDITKYGYAMNIDIAGISFTSLAAPASTISFFDSTMLTRNATAATSTLPQPGRYLGKNTIAYADGAVAP